MTWYALECNVGYMNDKMGDKSQNINITRVLE